MKFAVAPPNTGDIGDPRFAAQAAALAEASGWDGYFSWDALSVADDPPPVFDPFVVLAAATAATSSIRIGTCILVAARYPPHLLAMRLATLDVLSEGRLILGVGLGDGGEVFRRFGEAGEASVRAVRLDETLDIMTRLWSGETVTHHSEHFAIDRFRLTQGPVQQPRIPIWVGGDSAGAMRRAARWDGWIGPDDDPMSKTADDVITTRDALTAAGAGSGFDIAWASSSFDHAAEARVQDVSGSGATWWIEPLFGEGDAVLDRIRRGPPR